MLNVRKEKERHAGAINESDGGVCVEKCAKRKAVECVR